MTNHSQLTIEKELFKEHIQVTLSGQASVTEIKAFYRKVFAVAELHSISKLQVDTRTLELNYESSDILHIVKSLEDKLSQFKVARVVSPIGHKQMLIQQIAEQKALQVQNFTCTDAAKSWLLN